MNCENCYKNGHCWACTKWLGCNITPPNSMACFVCDRAKCPKEEETYEQ